MTLYYNQDINGIVENHPEGWWNFDVEGHAIINFDEAPDEKKAARMLDAATDLLEASDAYELTQKPEYERSND